MLLAQSCYREAIDEYQRDLSLKPGMIPAYNGLATSHNYLGEPELALAAVEKAMRLSLHDPWAPNFYASKVSPTASGRITSKRSSVWMRRSFAAAPGNPWSEFFEAGFLALAAHDAEAHAAMQRYLSSNAPTRTIAQWQRVRLPTDASRYLEFRQNFKEGLRKAGLPEE